MQTRIGSRRRLFANILAGPLNELAPSLPVGRTGRITSSVRYSQRSSVGAGATLAAWFDMEVPVTVRRGRG